MKTIYLKKQSELAYEIFKICLCQGQQEDAQYYFKLYQNNLRREKLDVFLSVLCEGKFQEDFHE